MKLNMMGPSVAPLGSVMYPCSSFIDDNNSGRYVLHTVLFSVIYENIEYGATFSIRVAHVLPAAIMK